MKKHTKYLVIGIVGIFAIPFFNSIAIYNTMPEDCIILTRTISEIKEGSTFDIVFKDMQGDRYYINRGLEQGLNLDSLNAKVLNKSVTLHLAKIMRGLVTSEHIAQLAIGNDIIFTEFK